MGQPQRKNIRLANWDYAATAYYHVTFCTHEKKKTLGRVIRTEDTDDRAVTPGQPVESHYAVSLSSLGKACFDSIMDTAEHYDGFTVDKFVIMPNHIHMLVKVDEREARASLGTFVGRVKSGASRAAAALGCGKIEWQRGYYDHIIRGEADYVETWKYIDENPAKWADDEYYA